MYLIEYVTAPQVNSPALHSELSLGTTVEEAIDHADQHLAAANVNYGARGYRIIGANKVRIAIGPQGRLDWP